MTSKFQDQPDPYEELGVDRDASAKEIKNAFRSKSQEHHPDKENGDHERFVRLNAAYKLLSDPDAKRVFDESGVTDDSHPHVKMAVERMKQLFAGYINQNQKESGFLYETELTSLPEVVNRMLAQKEVEHRNSIKTHEKIAANTEKLKKKIKCKKKTNLFATVSDGIIKNCELVIQASKDELEIIAIMRTIISDYYHDEEPADGKKRLTTKEPKRRSTEWTTIGNVGPSF